ncbi:MAG: hypothetical protein ACP6IU_11670 [Candidatus Asgardarchaeia archaeon]
MKKFVTAFLSGLMAYQSVPVIFLVIFESIWPYFGLLHIHILMGLFAGFASALPFALLRESNISKELKITYPETPSFKLVPFILSFLLYFGVVRIGSVSYIYFKDLYGLPGGNYDEFLRMSLLGHFSLALASYLTIWAFSFMLLYGITEDSAFWSKGRRPVIFYILVVVAYFISVIGFVWWAGIVYGGMPH